MAATDTAPATLGLIAAFADCLARRHVAYCQWKSTTGLDRALAGETDLDLLVDRDQAPGFRAAVSELGFRPFVSAPRRRFPGVEDYLGLDAGTGRVVHLHVYYQLVLGDDVLKNHRLPIERAVLDGTQVRSGIRVINPELELAILAVRAMLKYRDRDAIRDLLGHGRPGIQRDIMTELRDLLGRTDPQCVRETVERNIPFLPPDIVAKFLATVARDARDGRTIVGLRRGLGRALRPYERYGRVEAALRFRLADSVQRQPLRALVERIALRQGRRKSPATGGLTVAIVGIDGAGKSTVIRELHSAFGHRINVATIYLGSARPSRSTGTVQAVSRSARRARRLTARALGNDAPASRLARPVDARLAELRALAEARDRERRAAEGRRLAARGWLVLYDRYPLPGLRVGTREMDAARIDTPAGPRSLEARMAEHERGIYERIPPPDRIVVLRVAPEVARARKPGLDPRSVEAKAAALDALEAGGRVVVVDADRPLEEVVRDVEQIVWSAL